MKTANKYLVPLTALTLLGAASTLNALNISYTDTLPSEDVFLENTVVSSEEYNIQLRNYTNNVRQVGITFTAGETVALDKITFFVASSALASGTELSLDIYSADAETKLPITSLHSETGATGTTYDSESYMTFDLTTPYTLTDNETYSIVISFVSNALTNFYQAESSNGTTLVQWNDNGTTAAWSAGTGAPVNFVAQSIPEPDSSTLLLIAIPLAGILGFKRRKA